jgi:hypothetical protein
MLSMRSKLPKSKRKVQLVSTLKLNLTESLEGRTWQSKRDFFKTQGARNQENKCKIVSLKQIIIGINGNNIYVLTKTNYMEETHLVSKVLLARGKTPATQLVEDAVDFNIPTIYQL